MGFTAEIMHLCALCAQAPQLIVRLLLIRCGDLTFCPYNTPWDVLPKVFNPFAFDCYGRRLDSRVKKTRMFPWAGGYATFVRTSLT